jgi:hypothetical protein
MLIINGKELGTEKVNELFSDSLLVQVILIFFISPMLVMLGVFQLT